MALDLKKKYLDILSSSRQGLSNLLDRTNIDERVGGFVNRTVQPIQNKLQQTELAKISAQRNPLTLRQVGQNLNQGIVRPVDRFLNTPRGPNQVSISQAIRQTAPTVGQDFGNLYRNRLPGALGQMVGNTAQTVGTGVSNIVSGVDKTLTGKPVQGIFQGLKGAGQLATMTKSPLVSIYANILSNVGPSQTRRLATGFQRGLTQIDSLSPTTEAKNINIGPLSFDPLMTAGQMVGFTQNPINKKLFEITNKYIPTSNKNVFNWLLTTQGRGGLENIVQTLDQLPDDPKQALPFLVSRYGEGALMELGGQALGEGGKAVLNSKSGQAVAKQFTTLKKWLNEPILTKTLSDAEGGLTRYTRVPRWQSLMTEINTTLTEKMPVGMTIKAKPGISKDAIQQKSLSFLQESQSPEDAVKRIQTLEQQASKTDSLPTLKKALKEWRKSLVTGPGLPQHPDNIPVIKEIDRITTGVKFINNGKPTVDDLMRGGEVKPGSSLKPNVYNAEPSTATMVKQEKAQVKLQAQQAKADYAAWQKAVFQQEGATQTTSKAVGQAAKAVKTGTSSPVSNPEGMKDIGGLKAYGRDVYRNFKEVYGKNFAKVKELVLDPFDRSKGKMVEDLKVWTTQLNDNVVKKFNIQKGSKESAAIQQFGEGKIDQAQLVKQFGEKRAAQIIEADKWFRSAYDSLLEQVNATRARIYPNQPDKIIPRRNDYYRHFTELADGVRGLLNIFDNPANISSALSGTSEFVKPKSKWLSFAQKRLGIKTQEDAVGGFLDYLKAQTYASNIDPHIARFRSMAEELAANTAEGAEAGKLNGFIEYLQDFANDLSGKTNPADRFVQKIVGRKSMRVLNWLNNRVKANVILGNASSSIAQIFNVPQGIANAGPVNAFKGMGRLIAGIFDGGGEIKKSAFVGERYSDDLISQFDSRMIDQPKKLAAWITGVLDRVGTRYIWDMHYEKAISEGNKNPIKYADDTTRAMVAGRGIGEVPLIQKSKSFQLIAPFTLEVGNLWHVMGDWVDEKQFGKLVTFFVVSHVFNKGAEAIRGSDVNFDPIQASIDAYNTFMEEEDKRIGALKAGGRLVGEVASNVPLGQQAAAVYPEYGFSIGDTKMPTRKEFFGEGDPTRFGSGLPGVLASGLQDPLYKVIPPFGGQQIKRSIEGLQANAKGYTESKSGRVQYPVEQSVGKNIQRAVFGKYSTPEAREYFDKERTPLGEKQSEVFRLASNKKSAYDQIIGQREENAILDKAKDKLKSSGQKSTKVNNKYLLLQDDGSVDTIDVTTPIALPKSSKDPELNKKLLSQYKSKFTSRQTDITKLYDAGLITEEEAIKLWDEVEATKNKNGVGTKPKKVSLPRVKAITLDIPKAQPIKVKKLTRKKPTRVRLNKVRKVV